MWFSFLVSWDVMLSWLIFKCWTRFDFPGWPPCASCSVFIYRWSQCVNILRRSLVPVSKRIICSSSSLVVSLVLVSGWCRPHRMSPSGAFLMIRLELWGFGKNSTEVEGSSCPVIPGEIRRTSLISVDLRYCLMYCLWGFSTVAFLFIAFLTLLVESKSPR